MQKQAILCTHLSTSHLPSVPLNKPDPIIACINLNEVMVDYRLASEVNQVFEVIANAVVI